MKKNLLILFCIIICTNKIYSQTNWELLNPKPTANTGKGVAFVTNDIGYIITSNELLETMDAGTTWTKKQTISSGNDMSFYNTKGYIVGDYGYVLKSEDNGASWNQIAIGFSGNCNTVTILDDNNIILSTSNSIIKTTNGGSTWQSFTIPNVTVVKTAFTSSLVGHAVCNNGIILKTIDGGQNWYRTKDDSNTTPSDYFAVYFVNENIGFATREHNNMYKTTDAGETWVKITGTSQAVYDFHFLDESNGFATGEYGGTYKTTDGGNTWSSIFFQSGFIDGTSMYGIYFENKNIGYVTGARGRIIKTIDGGNNWTQYSPIYNTIKKIEFPTNNIGYTLVGNDYFKTTDSGNTWSYISTPLHYEYTNGFDFVNSTIGYSIGGGTTSAAGSVYKTVNGGISWTKANNGVNVIADGLYAIDFIDENIGFVSGGFNQPKTLKTIDGGNSWQLLNTLRFGQIQFVNDLVGYGNRIGYSGGRMYKTIDGGNTWNISIEVDKGINAFDFIDENNGYFVGDQGLIYKTNDGGITWKELEIPYEWYTKVKFYSKNVGYIADEDGKLYKTENGGLNWQYLTQQYAINSIELINDKIYTAGSNGKIYRSDVQYQPIVLSINPAKNVANSSASLTGNATSNAQAISNIQFEYSLDYSFKNIIATTPVTVASNESSNVSINLINLQSNTTYYYRLTAIQNSNINYSQILSFTTLPDYKIATNFTYNFSSTTAQISGNIISNGYDITNVEFQYGTSYDVLGSTLGGTPSLVLGNSTANVEASLTNLKPETKYFYRIKATHKGEDIYGNIQSFTTYPEYKINIYSPNINGTNATLSAYLTSYNKDITDIVFEYGTLDYKNNISTNPSQINASSSNYVSATITNLDANLNYYYRLKAMHNGQAIYSEERVFNFSSNIIIVNGTIEETQTNSLKLKGLINCQGAYLTNIHFEYGVTNSFGSLITGTPNFAYGYNTNLISGLINNPLANQTYYYRLVANNNGNVIYSDTYQYTTGTLSSTDFDLEKEILIFPNPATNFLNIKSNATEKIKSVEFYNTLSQLVYYDNVSNISDIKIDISNLKKGIYFVKINFENSKVASSKLILN